MKSTVVRSIRKYFTVITLTLATVIGIGSSSASTPFFEPQLLTIPRIDVDGFGPLQVVLELQDEASVTFGLFSAEAADTSISPTASFDNATGVLSIPTVRVDDIVYDVQFQLMAGETFQLTVAEPVSFPGQGLFAELCAGCHDIDGSGISAPALINCSRCGDVDALTNYINVAMPQGNAANCTGICATDIASYVRAVFNSGR